MDNKEVGAPNVSSLFTDINKLKAWSEKLEEWNQTLFEQNERLYSQLTGL